jgi:hypothetical protein
MTIVGMGIKRSHIDAGLVHSRGHRNFEAPTSNDNTYETGVTNFDTGNFEDILDFEQLAEQFVEDVAADLESDSDTDNEHPPSTPHNPAPIACHSSCVTRPITTTCRSPKDCHPSEVSSSSQLIEI